MASLHYKYAAMNSGKSTQLIQAHFNYLERGLSPYAMTPRLDTRAGAGIIRARVGLSLPVDTFGRDCDLFELIKQRCEGHPTDVFILDEAQFLTRAQVYQLARIVDELGIPVMAYGLKPTSGGNCSKGPTTCFALPTSWKN
jgi:thymidine kinase